MIQVDSTRGASVARAATAGALSTARTPESFEAVLAHAGRLPGVVDADFRRARGEWAAFQRHQTVAKSFGADNRSRLLEEQQPSAPRGVPSRAEKLSADADKQSAADREAEYATGDRIEQLRQQRNSRAQPVERRDHSSDAATRTTQSTEPVNGQSASSSGLAQAAQAEVTGRNDQGLHQQSQIAVVSQPPAADLNDTLPAGRPAAVLPPSTSDGASCAAGGAISAGPPSLTSLATGGSTTGAARQDASSAGAVARNAAPGSPQSSDFQNLLNGAGREKADIATNRPINAAALRDQPPTEDLVRLREGQAVSDLSRIVRSNLNARHSTMVLRLDPPQLGSIQVDVRVHDHALTLRIEAQTEQGREAIASRLDELKASLERHGIRVEQLDVDMKSPLPQFQDQADRDAGRNQSPWSEADPGTSGGREAFPGWSDHSRGFDDPGNRHEPHATMDWRDGQHGFDVFQPAESGVNVVV